MKDTGSSSGATVWVVLIAAVVFVGLFRFLILGGVAVLGLALVLGTAGLPHILMRFYTVPDARAARVSVLWASGFVSLGSMCAACAMYRW
mgnify:CR=1 FL=1